MDVRKRGMQTVTITTNNSFVECMLLKIYEIYIYIYIYNSVMYLDWEMMVLFLSY